MAKACSFSGTALLFLGDTALRLVFLSPKPWTCCFVASLVEMHKANGISSEAVEDKRNIIKWSICGSQVAFVFQRYVDPYHTFILI